LKITQYYQDSKAHTSENNKINAMASQINHRFDATKDMGLIEWHKTSPVSTSPKSMYIEAKTQYVYTGFGKLLSLLIRSMNLQSAISKEKDWREIETKETQLALVNDIIYKLMDAALSTGDEYPSSGIFYKSFYKKVKDERYFNKIINYIAEECQHTEAKNMKELLMYHIHDFANMIPKSDSKNNFAIMG